MQTTLFYHAFCFYFLIIDLFFLILAVITQVFNPIVELAKSTGNNEGNAEIEIQPPTAKMKKGKCFESYASFYVFHSGSHNVLLLLKDNFLLHLFLLV